MRQGISRTWAEIDLDALAHNYGAVRRLLAPGCRMMAVVKADAYGHGAVETARHLARLGVDYFGVAGLGEARELRTAGIRTPILILGYTPAESAGELVDFDLTQTIFDKEMALAFSRELERAGKTLKIHIKIDTGMSRLGLRCGEMERCAGEVEEVCALAGLEPEGIFTHFAVSEHFNDPFTAQQLENFLDLLEKLKRAGRTFALRHSANSGATLGLASAHLDMVRPGLILYGVYPGEDGRASAGLQPVMRLCSTIAQVKELEGGDTVSYGRMFTAPGPMKVAVVPIGYADGYPWALSGKGSMIVHGQRAPVVGRVCMDMTMIDVSRIDIAPGDTVTVMGRDGDSFLGADELAGLSGTIAYEIVCSVARRVPRVYLRDGEPYRWIDYLG